LSIQSLKVYADTSFLVSLYCPDVHSVRAVQEVRRSKPSILLSPLTELELGNALELRIFREEASSIEIRAARAEMQKHIQSGFFSVVSMPVTAYELAQRIAFRQTAATGVRTLDILHVASALLLRVEQFWTFDARQAKLAKDEGLNVH
jgi:predicted nucleic acid-binding protein